VSGPQVGVFQQGLILPNFVPRAKSLPAQSFWRKNHCSVSPTLLHFENVLNFAKFVSHLPKAVLQKMLLI
jgi:hypothetical protein